MNQLQLATPADGIVLPKGWAVLTTVERFDADLEEYLGRYGPDAYARFHRDHKAYDGEQIVGNILVNNGIQLLEDALIGTAITAFSNANARIGVGDSSTAAAASQTDLQAATNKLRKAMDATYPLHTDTTGTATSQKITFRSSFGTSEANWVWNEWIVANSATAATGRALNRKVENLGTKTSGTWTLTVDITIS